ncbi:MAG: ribosome biogenesis GTPase Der [Erysipelotrichaceae bacterium]|jgi:GTP-binding protein|nr:ribosome biogenesis GTPase Der [Erysipelotrichaceae bacterium]
MINGTLALIGRPNAGKSSLFNRLVNQRLAITDDTPGVTRDRLYGDCEWLTRSYRIIDTGGITMDDAPFQKEIRVQADIAREEADVILFVCDGQTGVTSEDQYIASLLKKTKKPVLVCVNKIDDSMHQPNIYEFYQLGLGDPLPLSSLHGIGVGDLLDAAVALIPAKDQETDSGDLSFCLIGKPNVGKSSLINAMLDQERVIVSEIAGTTRDAIDTSFAYQQETWVAIDTAGIRKKGKIYENIDKYALLRALKAVERSQVCLVVIDALSPLSEQDKHIAGIALEYGKGVILVVNKWDAIAKDSYTLDSFQKQLRVQLPYLDYAPILFVSAKTRQRVGELFPLIKSVRENCQRRITTSVLNDVLEDALTFTPPPTHNGKRLKLYYGAQVAVDPPQIVLFVNDPKLLHFSYQRYLENRLREAFDFTGTPLRVIARHKEGDLL